MPILKILFYFFFLMLLPAGLAAQHDSTVTTTRTVETRLAPTDSAVDGKVLEPIRSIVTTKTTVTTTTVVYGQWREKTPGKEAGQATDTARRILPVDTAAILKAVGRKKRRAALKQDSTPRVHGLFATLTLGLGTNRNGSPFVGAPTLIYPQRLASGLSKSFLLVYTRPKGFSIGVTLVEMQRSAPALETSVTDSRLRYVGLIGGGRMASARNYNAQFLLMGGLAYAGQRFRVHYPNKNIEVSSQRPCLVLRPSFEVGLIRNLQLTCGVQAMTSFWDSIYEVVKSPNSLDFLQPYSDGSENFFFYDVHVGLSYLLVK